MEISTINNIIKELCPEFHGALQPTGIKRIKKKGEYSVENSKEGSISDLIINVDKMDLRETYAMKRLKAEFNKAIHSRQKLVEVVANLHDLIFANATDYLLAYLTLTDDFMLVDDIYMVQEYDEKGFNPHPIDIVQGHYNIEIKRRGKTYLEVKCSEDGDEIGTVKRRLPSSLDIMINGLGALNEKRNKSGERFLHRVVALALKNKLNDAAQREGYNGCLLVPEKLDRFSLPKTLLVCEHRFKYDALKTAGYKV